MDRAAVGPFAGIPWPAYDGQFIRLRQRKGKKGKGRSRFQSALHARPDTARATMITYYLEQYGVDGERLPRELGQGMHEAGHSGRPYVP
jgi:hypothetical protein